MASTVSFYLFLPYVPFFGSAGFPSNDLTDDNKLASKDPCCEGDGCHFDLLVPEKPQARGLKTLAANLANQIIFEPVFFDPQPILQTGLLNHLEGFSCRSSRTLPLLFTSVGFAGNVLMHLWKDGFRTVSVFQATHTPKISQNT